MSRPLPAGRPEARKTRTAQRRTAERKYRSAGRQYRQWRAYAVCLGENGQRKQYQKGDTLDRILVLLDDGFNRWFFIAPWVAERLKQLVPKLPCQKA